MGRRLSFNKNAALEQAMALFWQFGYQGTSLKKLETALQLRPGSLYHSFGSKERLYSEVLDRYAAELTTELEAAITQQGHLLDGLKAFLTEAVLQRQQQRPSRACMIVKTLLELGDSGGDVADKADALLGQMEDCFIALFDSAKARGEISDKQSSRWLARQLQVYIIGIRGFALRRGVEDCVPSLIATALDSLFLDAPASSVS